MTSFYGLGERLGPVPSMVVRWLRQVDLAAGKAEQYRDQLPGLLTSLRTHAQIESVTASSALEGITAPPPRAEAMVRNLSEEPRNRSEGELRGYRNALTHLFDSEQREPWPTVPMILGVHRTLYEPTGAIGGGQLKTADNRVVEQATGRIRFEAVPAALTPAVLQDVAESFRATREREDAHPVILIGAFVLDFLVVHPFADGNGRVSRLLTNYLLDRDGYDVGKFVSLEKMVKEREGRYYDSLLASTHGWERNENDLWPWLGFFVETLASAYQAFMARTEEERGRGQKSERVRRFVLEQAPTSFSIADIQKAVSGVSPQTVRLVLNGLRDEGLLSVGKGRGARWKKESASARG